MAAKGCLALKEGELLSYDRLQILGKDSVSISKRDEGEYEINFAKIDAYEHFIKANL
ncbi:MAG: hypothetical protein OXB93_03955 [Cytophagales bacterium]|nr:hypothetical protein [Cytophagales bacterium]